MAGDSASSVIAMRGWQVLAIIGLPTLFLAFTFGSVLTRLSAVEERAGVVQSIEIRLERIQSTLERLDSALPDRVRAEVRRAMGTDK